MAVARPLKSTALLEGREAKLHGYLEQVAGQGLISREMAAFTWSAWERLAGDAHGLPVPDACPGPDGSLLYTWDRDEHHLELEFSADEPPSFFYANRETGALWEAPYAEPLGAEVKAKLTLFLAKR